MGGSAPPPPRGAGRKVSMKVREDAFSGKVVIVGGGIAGCAAAVSARKAGAAVVLLERTDMLLGGANRAGRMNYNGKMILAEECKAMGGGELHQALESITLHRGNIVDEEHAYIYNTAIAEATVRRLLREWGVEIQFYRLVNKVFVENGRFRAVAARNSSPVQGDVFIDATAGYGGVNNCRKYGAGCVMCVYYRCPTFGNRVSIATLAGAPELARYRADGTPGLMSGSTRLYKDSLDPDLQAELKAKGAISIKLPPEMVDLSHQGKIGEIRTEKQLERLNMVDIGSCVMCVALHPMPLDQLRKLPGLRNASIEDPLGGTVGGGSVGKLSMAPRDDALRVEGFRNLFVAGEKAGPGTGVDETICSGVLAGFNAARVAAGQEPVVLPTTTAIGDLVHFSGELMHTREGLFEGCSAGHGLYFERMKRLGFYIPDVAAIRARVEKAGVKDIFGRRKNDGITAKDPTSS